MLIKMNSWMNVINAFLVLYCLDKTLCQLIFLKNKYVYMKHNFPWQVIKDLLDMLGI